MIGMARLFQYVGPVLAQGEPTAPGRYRVQVTEYLTHRDSRVAML